MAPEYAIHGRISTKSDVYSFGVLVIEIITGCKNSSSCEPDGVNDLLNQVNLHACIQLLFKYIYINLRCHCKTSID